MNDLTKEELKWLKEEVRLGIDEFDQPEIAYIIYDKIQSLIDNYPECDHESDGTQTLNINAGARVDSIRLTCKHCGELYR